MGFMGGAAKEEQQHLMYTICALERHLKEKGTLQVNSPTRMGEGDECLTDSP